MNDLHNPVGKEALTCTVENPHSTTTYTAVPTIFYVKGDGQNIKKIIRKYWTSWHFLKPDSRGLKKSLRDLAHKGSWHFLPTGVQDVGSYIKRTYNDNVLKFISEITEWVKILHAIQKNSIMQQEM